MYIEQLKLDFDKTLVSLNVDYLSDKIHDLVLNVTAIHFIELERMVIYIKLNIPEDKNDRQFQKQIIKTVVDVGKLMDGIYGNPVVKTVMDTFHEAIDFEPGLPTKVVRTHFKINFSFLKFWNFFLKGTYKYNNLTISSKFFPIPFDSKCEINLRFITKVAGRPKSQFLMNIWARAGIKH